MVLTIGAVLLAAFLVPPQRSGYLDVAGYRALRAASWAAAGWTVAAVLLVPLNVADALGRPVGDVLDAGLLVDLVPRLSAATAWMLTALVAVVVLVGCRTVLTWGWTCRPVRAGAARPAAGGADRPLGRRGRPRPGHRQPGAARAGRVAVGGRPGRGARHRCRARAGPGDGAGHRGAAVLPARAGLLAGAGRDRRAERRSCGSRSARCSVRRTARSCWPRRPRCSCSAPWARYTAGRTVAPAARGEPRALLRLGGFEVLLMLATIGLAVALGRSAPPDTGFVPVPHRGDSSATTWPGRRRSPGWSSTGASTCMFGTAALVLGAVYVLAVRRLRRRGDAWAGRPHGGLAGRLRRAADGHQLRDRPVRPGDVQRAHGPAHDPRDAGADPARAGRAGDARAARPADRRARPAAGAAGVAAGGRALARRRAG